MIETQHKDNTQEILEDIIEMVLDTGVRMKDFYKIGDKETEALYAIAYNMYRTGQYEKALSLFKTLCFLDQLEPKYWFGLGATYQRLKNFERAASVYAYTTILEPDNPTPALHAAECLIALGKRYEAEGALLTALEFSEQNGKYEKERQRAKALLDTLKKQRDRKDE